MYAVIESGGKQYRVAVGDRVKVESLSAEPGAEVELDRVLLVADGDKVEIGSPLLKTKVGAKVLKHGRGEKIRILKFRRRKNSRTHAGHRQDFTELEITNIGGKSPSSGAKKAKKTKVAESQTSKTAKKKTTKKAKKATADKPKKEAASAKQSAKASSVDDLTQLSGVGPVLAKKLNAAGVTSLAQVAAFTDEDIQRIDAELNFKGRIERDDWVGQAKKLVKAQQ